MGGKRAPPTIASTSQRRKPPASNTGFRPLLPPPLVGALKARRLFFGYRIGVPRLIAAAEAATTPRLPHRQSARTPVGPWPSVDNPLQGPMAPPHCWRVPLAGAAPFA